MYYQFTHSTMNRFPVFCLHLIYVTGKVSVLVRLVSSELSNFVRCVSSYIDTEVLFVYRYISSAVLVKKFERFWDFCLIFMPHSWFDKVLGKPGLLRALNVFSFNASQLKLLD